MKKEDCARMLVNLIGKSFLVEFRRDRFTYCQAGKIVAGDLDIGDSTFFLIFNVSLPNGVRPEFREGLLKLEVGRNWTLYWHDANTNELSSPNECRVSFFDGSGEHLRELKPDGTYAPRE